MIAVLFRRIEALMDGSPSLAMAIATELAAFDAAGTGIHVRVAVVAGGIAIGVPWPVLTLHVSGGMGPGIRPPDAVTVRMAGDARGISSLRIVTAHARFDVALRKLRMASTAAANADRGKVDAEVPCGFDRLCGDIVSCGMTVGAEFPR